MTLPTTVPITDDLVRGASTRPTDPRPGAAPAAGVGRAQCPTPQLAMAESQPSGVRLALRTAATVVELDVLVTRREVRRRAAARPTGASTSWSTAAAGRHDRAAAATPG